MLFKRPPSEVSNSAPFQKGFAISVRQQAVLDYCAGRSLGPCWKASNILPRVQLAILKAAFNGRGWDEASF